MKLDRNLNKDGSGKYALINLRKLREVRSPETARALRILSDLGVVHWGDEGPGAQFWVMKYSDPFTWAALKAYALDVKSFAERQMAENRCPPAEYEHWMEYHRELMCEVVAAQACEHKLPT